MEDNSSDLSRPDVYLFGELLSPDSADSILVTHLFWLQL